jgi:hypothetical protein
MPLLPLSYFAVVWNFRLRPRTGLEDLAVSQDRRLLAGPDSYFKRLSMFFALSTRTLKSSSSFAESFARADTNGGS